MRFDGRAWRWILAVAIVLVTGCPPAPDDPTTPGGPGTGGTDEAAVRLILEDEQSAVWMVMDNLYMESADENWQKWNGILFQLGSFWEYASHAQPGVPEQERVVSGVLKFEELRIVGENGEVALTPNDFTWVNVVGENDGSPPVADPKLVEYLFPAPWMEPGDWTCAPVDTCERVYPPPDDWTCESPLTSIPSSCLRLRSLHAYYRPERIVTYWQGRNGWNLQAARQTGLERNRFEFSLADPVAVTVYDQREVAEKNAEVQELGRITEIRLLKPAGVTHGEIHTPPTDSYPPPVSGGN